MLRVGHDLVQISRIAQSIERFGRQFLERLLTPLEIEYVSSSPPLAAERVAARFAAKEAVIKALSLSETGLDWRCIEVQRRPSGDCQIALHGVAKQAAHEIGITELSVSLTHEGDYASAVVVALANTHESMHLR